MRRVASAGALCREVMPPCEARRAPLPADDRNPWPLIIAFGVFFVSVTAQLMGMMQ